MALLQCKSEKFLQITEDACVPHDWRCANATWGFLHTISFRYESLGYAARLGPAMATGLKEDIVLPSPSDPGWLAWRPCDQQKFHTLPLYSRESLCQVDVPLGAA